jgi:geranylgeranyl diphosphate synthase type II
MLILAYQYFEQYEPAVLCDWQNYLVKRAWSLWRTAMGCWFWNSWWRYHSGIPQNDSVKNGSSCCCSHENGALVAEASVENADLIYEFGLNLGLAFQLQDDYLDAFVTLKLWKASRRWYNWE